MDHFNNPLIPEEDDRPWLVTYADLVTLLLVFFVLLYSLAHFETENYRQGLEKLSAQVEDEKMMQTHLRQWKTQPMRIDEFTGIRSREQSLVKSVNRFARQIESPQDVHTDISGGKITIRLSGETLFASGKARLNPESFPLIDRLIGIFNDFPEYTINIKGHTDNQPIATRQFPSNWELSAIRATTVLKYMIQQGISPQRLTATGYGDSLPRVPNSSDANRATNRRVEFVLEKKESFD
ncbi:MAG: OmpA family protein [Desulfobacterales bacterium]|nr:OmpA family protein [Desulfobacterales bacterium]